MNQLEGSPAVEVTSLPAAPTSTAKRLFVFSCLLGGIYSFAFHASWNYFRTPTLQIGSLAICSAVLGIPLMMAYWARRSERFDLSLQELLVPLLGGIVFFFAYLPLADFSSAFTDETFWMGHVRAILNADIISPMGTIGDQPADWHAWPLTALTVVLGEYVTAIKVATFLYGFFSVIAICALVQETTGRSSWLPSVLIGSYFPLVQNSLFGWQNVAVVSLLGSLQLLFAWQLVNRKSYYAAVMVGVSSGLAVWTLYTPCLLTAPLLGLLTILPNRVITLQLKITFIAVTLLVASPTLGKVISQPSVLSRHQSYFVGGREASAEPYVLSERLAFYLQTAKAFTQRTKPHFEPSSFIGLSGVRFQWLTFVVFVAGVLGAGLLVGWGAFLALLFLSLSVLAMVIVSNPFASIWREVVLFPLAWTWIGWGAVLAERAIDTGLSYLKRDRSESSNEFRFDGGAAGTSESLVSWREVFRPLALAGLLGVLFGYQLANNYLNTIRFRTLVPSFAEASVVPILTLLKEQRSRVAYMPVTVIASTLRVVLRDPTFKLLELPNYRETLLKSCKVNSETVLLPVTLKPRGIDLTKALIETCPDEVSNLDIQELFFQGFKVADVIKKRVTTVAQS